jgi:hypothetical protein
VVFKRLLEGADIMITTKDNVSMPDMQLTEQDIRLYQSLMYGGGFAIRLKKQTDGTMKFEERADIKQFLKEDLELFIAKLDHRIKEQYRAVEEHNANRKVESRIGSFAFVDEFYILEIEDVKKIVRKEITERI